MAKRMNACGSKALGIVRRQMTMDTCLEDGTQCFIEGRSYAEYLITFIPNSSGIREMKNIVKRYRLDVSPVHGGMCDDENVQCWDDMLALLERPECRLNKQMPLTWACFPHDNASLDILSKLAKRCRTDNVRAEEREQYIIARNAMGAMPKPESRKAAPSWRLQFGVGSGGIAGDDIVSPEDAVRYAVAHYGIQPEQSAKTLICYVARFVAMGKRKELCMDTVCRILNEQPDVLLAVIEANN